VNAGRGGGNQPIVSTSTTVLRAALLAGLTVAGAASPARADPPPVREVDRTLVQVDREAVRLLRLLDESRRAHAVTQIACVDRQLSQLNSFGRVLSLHRDRLVDALERGDAAAATRERQVIRRVTGQLVQIARAGRACVYPPAGEADRTVVVVTISPDTPRLADLGPPPR
jgi:hypothetical protein